MLYEIFKRLMFGDSCLTFCPGLEVVMCFCAGFLAFVSSSQGRFDVLVIGCLDCFCLLAKILFICWNFFVLF